MMSYSNNDLSDIVYEDKFNVASINFFVISAFKFNIMTTILVVEELHVLLLKLSDGK